VSHNTERNGRCDEAPRFIQFFPAMRCNSSCAFCFNRGYPADRSASSSDCRALLRRMTDAGIAELDLLGGEPTLYPGIEELVASAIGRGLSVFLSSNGANTVLLDRLIDSNPSGALAVGISVNEAPSTALQGFIVRRRPLLKSVCRRDASLPEFAWEYLQEGLQYRLLYRDAVFPEELGDTLPFERYLDRLKSLMALYPNLQGVYCEGFISSETGQAQRPWRCPAGTLKLSVLPDGAVYPCYLFMRNPEFAVGNIFRDDFVRILSSPVLRYFREFRGNRCPRRECVMHASCGGGCPAVALLIGGSIHGADPRCVPPPRP